MNAENNEYPEVHEEIEQTDSNYRTLDEALQRANRALTSMDILHEAMGSGAWNNTFDRKGHSKGVEWSDAFRALLGFESEEDFPNKEEIFLERIHPDDLRGLVSDYRKAIVDDSGKIVYDTESGQCICCHE